MMPLWRCRAPKIARRAVFGRMNDYDLENQSRDWCRSGGRTTTGLTGIGTNDPSRLNMRRNVRHNLTGDLF
jgi:hypothetical protein